LAAELWQRTAQSFSQFTFASAGTEPTTRLIAMAAAIDFNIVSLPHVRRMSDYIDCRSAGQPRLIG
jgi:hypothetical protein